MRKVGTTDQSKSLNIVVVAVHAGLLIAVSVFSFSRNTGILFPGGDGAYALQMILGQHTWFPFSFGLSLDPLQGLGDIQIPFNTKFEPSFQVSLLLFGKEAVFSAPFQISVHVFLALELFVATVALARALEIDWITSLIAAWTTPLLALPYFRLPVLFPLLLGTYATLVSDVILVLAAFAAIGRGTTQYKTISNALLAILIFGLLVHATLLCAPAVILWAPVLIVGNLGILWGAKNKSELVAKVVWGAGAATIWMAIFAVFVVSLFDYTVPRFFGEMLTNDRADLVFISTWFTNRYAKLAVLGAVGGLIISTIIGSRRIRRFAMANLMFMAILLGFGVVTLYRDFWNGPSPIYFEAFIWPIYSIFGAYLFTTIARLSGHILRPFFSSDFVEGQRGFLLVILPAVVMSACVVVATSINIPNVTRAWGPLPPSNRPIMEVLKKQIAIEPGMPFRGRVATLFALNTQDTIGWPEIFRLNKTHIERAGNDFYWSSMWLENIPTLFEYNQLTSPAFFYSTLKWLGRVEDKQTRNVIVFRRARPTILALLGVRFIVSDAPLSDPFQLISEEHLPNDDHLYLYENPSVNLGWYSPTEIEMAGSLKEAIDKVDEANFDGRRTAILFSALPDEPRLLVRAEGATVKMDRGAILVQAYSPATSLLVLPFGFSNCQTMTYTDTAAPKLVRVDGFLTGVVFSGSLNAEIKYFTSPFAQPTCRIKDSKDLEALRPF